MMATIRPLDRVAHPRVLVVGGGIAGIQAALEVAAAGLPVTLAEAGFSIGGRMAQLDKTFPTNDCAMCILSPRMLEISRHPLITHPDVHPGHGGPGPGRGFSGALEPEAPVRGRGQVLRLRRVRPGLPPESPGPV